MVLQDAEPAPISNMTQGRPEGESPPPGNSEGEQPPDDVSREVQEPDNAANEGGESAEDERFAQKMAIIMRREKQLLEKERQLKDRLRTDPEFLEFQKFKKLREKAGEAPDELLKEFGWDYDRLIRHKLGEKEKEPSQEEKLQARIDALEEKLSQREKTEQETQAQAQERAALHQIQKELEANNEEFELTLLNNASNLVYDVIKEHYSSTGEILPTKQAAQAVEDYLDKETEKLTKSRKLRKRFIPDEPVDTEGKEAQESPPTQAKETPHTISSQAIQSTSSDDGDENQPWDEEASRREIARKWREGYYSKV